VGRAVILNSRGGTGCLINISEGCEVTQEQVLLFLGTSVFLKGEKKKRGKRFLLLQLRSGFFVPNQNLGVRVKIRK